MNETISASIDIFHRDADWWLLITGELFGPYASQDEALDAIAPCLREME